MGKRRADFAGSWYPGSERDCRRAIEQFPQRVADAHTRDGSIPMFPIRHWGHIVDYILRDQHPRDEHLIPCPETGERVPYIPFVDCILDMPYRDDAIVVLKSVCGDR